MANSNKLSIYLIKQEFAEADELILSEDAIELSEIPNVGKVYYRPSQYSEPSWIKSFFRNSLHKDELENISIFSANTRAIMICRISVKEECGKQIDKAFALTWGYGKNLLEDNVIEEDFGLKVVLNTIKEDSLRRINKINVGGNQKNSNEQLPLKSRITDFGFDLDRDLLGSITGQSNDKTYVSGIMTGSELLSVTAEVDITNIRDFLHKTYNRYKQTKYKSNFEWVDHIKKIKDVRLKERLDNKVIELIQNDSSAIWMAVPEVIDWENISGFKYCGREKYDDIDILIVKKSFKNGLINIEQLKNKKIIAISQLDETTAYASWSAYKCLCGEVEIDEKTYCISNGQWFSVDTNFIELVNQDYKKTKISSMPFIDFVNGREEDYNRAFQKTSPQDLLCLDQKNIMHGGGKSKIELCDILTKDGTYIHIKKYASSSVLSHLFNQGLVSAQLILGDAEFREKANKNIKENGGSEDFIIVDGTKPNIIFAIITKSDNELPPIPFFSKVAFRYVKNQLEMLGCDISIKNIKRR